MISSREKFLRAEPSGYATSGFQLPRARNIRKKFLEKPSRDSEPICETLMEKIYYQFYKNMSLTMEKNIIRIKIWVLAI